MLNAWTFLRVTQGADGMCTAGQGGIGGAVGAGSTRWGGSGVAAMRAEHESEVNALKEQTQDMVMKYQATATRVRELEQRCAEQSEGIEELQLQLTKQQVGFPVTCVCNDKPARYACE